MLRVNYPTVLRQFCFENKQFHIGAINGIFRKTCHFKQILKIFILCALLRKYIYLLFHSLIYLFINSIVRCPSTRSMPGSYCYHLWFRMSVRLSVRWLYLALKKWLTYYGNKDHKPEDDGRDAHDKDVGERLIAAPREGAVIGGAGVGPVGIGCILERVVSQQKRLQLQHLRRDEAIAGREERLAAQRFHCAAMQWSSGPATEGSRVIITKPGSRS